MSDITLTDLTNENGEGVFDKLMSSMRGVLKEEFSSGRITSTDYSKVLISVTDSILNQSMQFLLQKDQAAKQVEVLEAQRLLAVAQELVVQKEVLLTQANIEKTNKEIIILDTQEQVMEAQVVLTEAQAAKVTVEVELLEIEKGKLAAEVNLMNAKVNETNKQVEVLNAQLVNLPKEGQLLDKQILKTGAETTFLDQRIKTEIAQILDVVAGTVVSGVIGKQKDLYAAQTAGFSRDAEQKLAKIVIDTWVTRRSTDEATPNSNINLLSDPNIGAIMAKCMTSLNITPVTT